MEIEMSIKQTADNSNICESYKIVNTGGKPIVVIIAIIKKIYEKYPLRNFKKNKFLYKFTNELKKRIHLE